MRKAVLVGVEADGDTNFEYGMEELKGLDLPVIDRTNLILEIFEKRARTKEARLQMESANLQYMLPRVVGIR